MRAARAGMQDSLSPRSQVPRDSHPTKQLCSWLKTDLHAQAGGNRQAAPVRQQPGAVPRCMDRVALAAGTGQKSVQQYALSASFGTSVCIQGPGLQMLICSSSVSGPKVPHIRCVDSQAVRLRTYVLEALEAGPSIGSRKPVVHS